MGKSYYYFAASLPLIDFEGVAPMSVEDFLQDADRLLSTADAGILKSILSDDVVELQISNPILSAWIRFNNGFINEMVAFRTQNAGKDPLDFIKGERSADPYLGEIIQQAAKEENLLKGERLIAKARWQFLEKIEVGHFFDFESLMIYALKLKILQRFDAINSATGGENFEEYKEVHMPLIGQI